MKTKPIAGTSTGMEKASKAAPKATTSMFSAKGTAAKAASNTMPSKMILD